ncbi:MAG: RNA polymerase sporulation sigma factor SigE [Lachnospiraceae bacterium]|jgi:RNA polymerase sporulation-specific sigma factor|nr:RNA polymerase sporulation sigma factor SigE [Lachnospiraceae bacterium]
MNILKIVSEKITDLYVKYMDIEKLEELENLPIFYIAGSQTLPPPLSGEEEEEYLEKLSNGEEEAKKILVERNLRLVVYIAKKFENTGVGIEDLISIGTIGLMKAINTFNTGKNIKLATYASRCIENEILMFLRRSNKIKGEISIDEPLNQDGDGNELLLSELLGTDPDITSRRIEDEVDKNLLRSSIEKLSKREKNIMELRFGYNSGEEKTQKEVADMLGISQSYISRLEKRIIGKMKQDIISKTG